MVALLVDVVTKIGRLNFSTKEQQQAESLRKMLIAMGKDIRVIIIKLADRLHNMQTLNYKRVEKQKEEVKLKEKKKIRIDTLDNITKQHMHYGQVMMDQHINTLYGM